MNRKAIMDNFYAEIDEIKKRPGYEEARKTHLEEIKAKIGINKLKKEKEKLQKEYEEKMAHIDEEIEEKTKVYEDAQIKHRGDIEYGEIKKNLIGNFVGVMEDLNNNHRIIKENSEYMGLKGKELHLTLPAVGKFKGYKFDCFISDSKFRFDEMNHYNGKYNFYDIDELCKLGDALKAYLEEYNINIDTVFPDAKIKIDIKEQNILTTTKIGLPIIIWILGNGPHVIGKYDTFTEDFDKFYSFSWDQVRKTMYLNENVGDDKGVKFLLK